MASKKCLICNSSFSGRRDAKTCSVRCRKRLQLLKLSFGVPAKKSFAKTLSVFILGIFSILSLVFSINPPSTSAAASSYLNFQARLLNSAGNVVPDGNYNIDFKIYNADSTTGSVGTCSSSCLWEETRKNSNSQGVRVVNGYLSVKLGEVNPFPNTINWDQELWLTMNIGGTTTGASVTWDGEMQSSGHSIQLTAVPLAFAANKLATGSGSSRGTLSFASLGQATDITLPDPGASTATVCYQNASACGFLSATTGVQLQGSTPGSQQTGNFNISGTGIAATSLLTPAIDQATAGALGIANSTATAVNIGKASSNITTTVTGLAVFKPSTGNDSTTAFQIQNAAGSALLVADTTNNKILTTNLEAINPAVLSSNTITPLSSTVAPSDDSIALGSDGFARIAYYDNTNADLKFLQCTNTDCSTSNQTTLDSTGNVGEHTSIALGSDGFARIAYYDNTNDHLKFAQCTNADCSTNNITTVDSSTSVGQYTSIALGSDGFARISYYDFNNGDLKFAQCTNAACSTSNINTVDSTGDVGRYTSIALGSDGFARISYYDNTNGHLKFAQCTNAACSTKNITTVDSSTLTGFYTATAMGSDGFARISYYDSNLGDLKFAQCTNAACSTKNITTIDSTGDVGKESSTAMGSDGFARISYYDQTNTNLKFAQCTNAACSTSTITTVDSTGSVGEFTSLALGSDGYARIVYYDRTNNVLKFAGPGLPSLSGSSIGSASAAYNQLYVKGINTDAFTLSGTTGTASFKNLQDSSSAFQIQNAAGSNLLNVDTSTTNNLITNGDIEAQGTNGWTPKGGSTLTRVTTQQWQGNGSLQVATTTAANDGAQYTYNLAPSTNYTLSFYAKVASGTISDVNIGERPNGADLDCATGIKLNTDWTRISCSFNSGATISSSNVYIKKTGTSAETFFIDGIQLETGTTITSFNAGGSIQLNGTINSPVVIQAKSKSTSAFQVNSSTGYNLLNVDTLNGYVINNGVTTPNNELQNPGFEAGVAGIAGDTTSGWNQNGSSVIAADSTNAHSGNKVMVVDFGNSNFNTVKLYNVLSGQTYELGGWIKKDVSANGNISTQVFWYDKDKSFLSLTNGSNISTSTSYTQFNSTFTPPSNAVYAQFGMADSSHSSGKYYIDDMYLMDDTHRESPIFQNSVDSTSAFQIQNAAGSSTIFNADTQNNRIGIGTNTPSYQLDVTGTLSGSGTSLAGFSATATSSNPMSAQNTRLTVSASSASTNTYTANNNIIQSTNANTSGATLKGFHSEAGAISGGNVGTAIAGDFLAYSVDTGSGAATVQNAMGIQVQNALNSGSTLTNNAGIAVANQTGGTNNTNLLLGTTTTPAGNYSIYNASTYNNYFAGATTIKNDSTAAFQVQNTSGGSLLLVDSTNSNITVNGNDSGIVQTWQSGSGTGMTATNDHGTIIVNGYIYVIGGVNSGGSDIATVQFSKLQAGGGVTSPGTCANTWCTTTALPDVRDGFGIATYNGYIYVVGGSKVNGNPSQSTTYYGKVNTDGTISNWQSSPTTLPAAAGKFMGNSVAYNGYLYFIGGQNSSGTAIGNSYYTKINADGSIGATWTSTNSEVGTAYATAVVANGYVYVLGGFTGSGNISTVQYAKLNSSGTLSTWNSTTSLPRTRNGGNAAVINGYLYYYGGYTSAGAFGSPTANTYFAPLNADGTVGTWSCQGSAGDCAGTTPVNSTAMPSVKAGFGRSSTYANGYIYTIAGWDTGVSSTVYYTSTSRIKINGSIDLVGDNGENLAEGGSGGSLTAGDTRIVGNLNVQGTTSVQQGLTVGDNLTVGGSALFQNSIDSTAAFQVQNTSSGSLLLIDSTNSNISLLGNNTGEPQAWTATTPLTSGAQVRDNSAGVTYNGYYYVINGDNGTSIQNSIAYSKINADGTLNTWSTTGTSVPSREMHAAVVANSYMYILGGTSVIANTDVKAEVYYAKINADGTVGAFNTTQPLPAARKRGSAVVMNGYIYYIGGDSSSSATPSASASVYYAKLNADGTVGAWATVSNANTGIPTAEHTVRAITANGYIYVLGGCTGTLTPQNTVYYVRPDSSGNISSNFTSETTNPLPAARCGGGVYVANGYVYYAGGDNSGVKDTVYYAPLNANGSLGTWVQQNTANDLPAVRETFSYASANGYLYAVGGWNGTTQQSTAYYTSTTRVKIGGGLDLVGISGENLADGGSGGSLTAGNTNIVGNLQVQGAGSVKQGLTVGDTLTVGGSALFQNSTNSSAAFQIQNAAGISLINVDTTTNNLISSANANFEAATTWSSKGTIGSSSRTTTTAYLGSNSLGVTTSGNANTGVKYGGTSLSSNTMYQFSAYVRSESGSIAANTILLGRQDDNVTDSDCTSSPVITAAWTQITCTFTTGTVTGGGNLYIKQTDTASRTFYIDAVQLVLYSQLSNPSIEQSISGNWTLKGAATISQDATQSYDGTNSLKVITTTASADGAKQNITLSDSTTYTLSFYAKLDGGSSALTTLQAGYSSDGSTDNNTCISGQTVVSTGWTYYTCTLTTPSSHSGTPFIWFRHNSSTVQTFYLDAIQLTVGRSSNGSYQDGRISFGGIINSSLILQNTNDSTTAFQVQNAAAASLFAVDSANLRVIIGLGSTGTTTPTILVLDNKTTSGDPSGVNGAMYYNANSHSFRCYEDGQWQNCGGLVSANSSIPGGNTITNTLSETNFASNYSLPANYCQPGRVIRIKAQGTWGQSANDSITMKLKFGSTVIGNTGNMNSSSTTITDQLWSIDFDIICDTTGATGTVEGQGTSHFYKSSNQVNDVEMVNTSTVTIDTTATQTIQMSAQWNAARTSDSITLRQFIVEGIGP